MVLGSLLQRRTLRGLAVGAGAFLFSLILSLSDVFVSLEWKSWDVRLRLFANHKRASENIALILIDQYSLDLYEEELGLSWPWPRQIYSSVIRFLNRGRVKAICFDLMMSENSRYGIEDDENLGLAMREAGNVFLPFFLSQEKKEDKEEKIKLLIRFARHGNSDTLKNILAANSVTTAVESLLLSCRGAGNVQFSSDADSIFRRLPLLFSYEGLLLPSLPLALAEFLLGTQNLRKIPQDSSGRMIIRYYGPSGTYRTYSIAAIINSWALIEEGKPPQIQPQEFQGKVVFIGGSAPGLLDLRPTPFSPVYAGTEIQATATDNLLQKDFIRIPPKFFTILAIFFFALFTGIGASRLKEVWVLSLFFLFALVLPALSAIITFFSGYWMGFVVPELAILLSFISASLLNYSFEGKQRRFIKNVFRYYLSPDVIERILRNPELLRLGGEKREITSFFSDVAGFTAISESLSPEELVNLLNAYLSEMTEIILSHGGTLDKYEGDAIVAFWNAPLDQPDHALKACRAALRCLKRLEELRPFFRERYGSEISMRIGINSGLAVVGNMGSGCRFDYTAMGDTVNLASRLEGACKQYGVCLLIGEKTAEQVKEALVIREVDIIRVVGKRKPARVFEIIGEKETVTPSERERVNFFERGLEAYRNHDWQQARSFFERLGEDRLAQIYIYRCLKLEKEPPLSDWDGVFDLREK